MKKILSLLVTFIVAVSMSAQTQTGNKMEVKLDSVVTTQQSGGTTSKSKEEYTYDDQGNQTSSIKSQWTEGAWVNNTKYEYTYDDQGNKTSYIISKWTEGAWVNNAKYEYTYDAQGNQTSYIYSIWTEGAWVNNTKYEYIYDDQGNKTSSIFSQWTAGAWVNNTKYEYTYDDQGNQTSYIISKWTAGAWVNSYKYEYTYDNQGKQTSEIYSKWTAGAWVNSSKGEYAYDDQGNKTSYIISYWTAGAWVNSSKYEYTYDNQGKQTSSINSKWTAGAWVNNSKIEYTYDNQGNKTSSINSKWTAGAWVESYRTSYDNHYKPSKLTFATPSITMDALAEQEVKLNLSKEGWPLSSLQMNITLPDGISYVDGSAALGTMADFAELSFKKYEGSNKYNVQILTNNQNEFTGDDSDVLTFKFKADKGGFTDQIKLTNIIGSTTTAEKVTIEDASADITVNKIDPGLAVDKGTSEDNRIILYNGVSADVTWTTPSTGKVEAYGPLYAINYLAIATDNDAKKATLTGTGDITDVAYFSVTLTQAEDDVYKAASTSIYVCYLNKAVADVIEKINAIGTVEFTDACKAKIDDARTAYDALTGDKQTQVTNYSTLTDAEERYLWLSTLDILGQKLAVAALIENPTKRTQLVISAATDVYDTSTSTKKEIEDAIAALNDAILKEPLAKKVAEANKIADPSDDLVAAIAAAVDVIDTADATQALVDGALADLEAAMQVATGINSAAVTAKASKFIENGKVVILRNGRKFTATGALLK